MVRNHRNINSFNLIVPYVNHQECFDDEVELICDVHERQIDTYCFKFFNDIITDTLYEVEKNGLKIIDFSFNIINIQNKIYEGIFLDKKKINKYPRYIFLSKKYKPQIKEIKNFDLLNHTIKYFLN